MVNNLNERATLQKAKQVYLFIFDWKCFISVQSELYCSFSFSVSWVPDPTKPASAEEMARALSDAAVFVVFVSVNYAKDEDCVTLFKFAVLTLRKPMVVIAIGENFDWKSSKIGIHLSDVVSGICSVGC